MPNIKNIAWRWKKNSCLTLFRVVHRWYKPKLTREQWHTTRVYLSTRNTSIITHIFKLVLQTAVFPQNMQIKKIIVLHIIGNTKTAGNVHITHFLEGFRANNTHTKNHLKKKAILFNSQYGSRGKRNTEMALMTEKELITSSFERKLYTLVIFIDFAKAFDRFKRLILIQKVEWYRICEISSSFKKLFLEHPKQHVYQTQHRWETEFAKVAFWDTFYLSYMLMTFWTSLIQQHL